MPANKSKRMATRQAQLSGRSTRRRVHGPSGIPLPYAASDEGQSVATIDGATGDATVAAPARQTATQAGQRQGLAGRSFRGRASGNLPPPQAYFGREMLRIAMNLAIILGILVALTFWLRR